jgi:hypothetical protein
VYWLAILAKTHVTRRDTHDRAVLSEHLRRGKARIDFDTERLCLGRKPSAYVAERNNEIAMVRHQRRRHEIGQLHRGRPAEPIKPVIGNRGLDGGVLPPPFRKQPVKPDGVD